MENKKKHRPVRQCIACFQHFFKDELLRVVSLRNNTFQIDMRQRLEGRSVYSCKSSLCIQKIYDKRLIDKKFQTKLSKSIYIELGKTISQTPFQKISSLIGLCIRMGRASLGFSKIQKDVLKGSVLLIIIDSSTGKSTMNKMLHFTQKYQIPHHILDKEYDLGTITGKVNLKCIGIADMSISQQIKQFL